jgi:hypothetical protein
MAESTDQRLDRLIGLFELAYSDELAAARQKIRADSVVAAILEATEDWVQVGVLKTAVANTEKISEKTVQRRISEMVTQRLLQADGLAVSRRVKSTGLA